jgi:hypothetical protein
MTGSAIRERFSRALDALVALVRDDDAVLAAILCGSLAHDTVWAGSDIDLVLVTIDDPKVPLGHRSLYADGVNVHAQLVPRAQFRRLAEGALRNSFMHSLLAKGKLLYAHDESIGALFAQLTEIGERDTRLALLGAGLEALGPIYKAHKWLITRGDLAYTSLWILYAATPLAQIEIIARQLLADREVIPQAMQLNPAFFSVIYLDLLNGPRTPAGVEAALAAADQYLAERAPQLFASILDHLREAGETRSCTEIEDHFRRNHGIEGVSLACEYLADQGLIGKASIPVRLTRRSRVDVQELAFFALAGGAGAS